MSDLLVDHKERSRIAECLDMTFLVEAAAGTGKTTSMVGRMLQLIATGTAQIQGIAAVTFTRKAAAHLKQRFQSKLEQALRDAPQGEESRRLREALESLDQCFVGTIHSFCGKLLRERSLDAGVPPDFQEIEELELHQLRDEFWQNYLVEILTREDSVLDHFVDLAITLDTLAEVFSLLCGYPDTEFPCQFVDPPDFAKVRPPVLAFLDDMQTLMPVIPHEKGRDGLQHCVIDCQSMQRNRDVSNDTEFVSLLQRLNRSVSTVISRWRTIEDGRQAKEAYNSLCKDIIEPALGQWREYLYPKLISFVQPAVQRFQESRVKQGKLSFDDLLILLRNLLRDNSDTRVFFQQRYTHIMVDEFQDTDPIQAEIMMFLAGRDPYERDWTKQRPRPGSLFVVGDPKQSIYRFRRADISTYKQAKEIIVQSGGAVLHLVTNFRSAESICRFSNDVFGRLFPTDASEYQAAHAEFAAVRDDSLIGGGVYRLDVEATGTNNAEISRADAAQLAQFISRTIASKKIVTAEDGSGDRPAEPGDFMILLWNKQHLGHYASALEMYGIPYELTGAGEFQDSEEVKCLLYLLRAAISPDDTISLVAFLRGLLCGIRDDELYQLCKLGGKLDFTTNPPKGASKQIYDAWDFLRFARQCAIEFPPSVAISRICDQLGIIPVSMSRENGSTRAGNLYKAISLSRSFEADGLCFSEIIDSLTALQENRDTAALNLSVRSGGAVKIMNLHKAKGLEASFVFLANPVKSSNKKPTAHMYKCGERKQAFFTLGPVDRFHNQRIIAQPPGWDEFAANELKYLEAERLRQLYVAATRSRDSLIVSTSENDHRWKQLTESITDKIPIPTDYTQPDQADRNIDLVSTVTDSINKSRLAKITVDKPTYCELQASKTTRAATVDPTNKGFEPYVSSDTSGRSRGRVMHRLLALMMSDKVGDISSTIKFLLKEEELDDSLAADIEQAALKLSETNVWKSARSSSEKYIEIPFGTNLPEVDHGENATLIGAIDLVFRIPGGWMIVDYKSDRVGDRIQQLTATYAPQIQVYTNYWKDISNEPTYGSLLFLDTCELVQVA